MKNKRQQTGDYQ